MRKKDIEKIAPLPVEKAERKYKMVAVAEIKMVGAKEHLIIDFYYNKKAAMKKPHMRKIININEYANRSNGIWNSKTLLTKNYTYVWNDGVPREDRVEKSEVYVSEESKKTICLFEKKITRSRMTEHSYYHPLDSVGEMENRIDANKRIRRENKKQELLDNRMRAVSEAPQEFIEWSKGKLTKGYMYYKRRNRRYVDLLCSECGIGYTKAYKRAETFEGQLESVIEYPVQNCRSECELCGAHGIYKQRGRYEKSVDEMAATTYLIELHGDNDAVVRMFNVRKYLRTSSAAAYTVAEKARLFIGPEIRQKYWACSRWGDGKWTDEWTWYNTGSKLNPDKDTEGYLWPGSNITNTYLRYSQIDAYALYGTKQFRPMQYAEVYKDVPELEMVYKLGMTELMKELVERGGHILRDGADFVSRLGIAKKNLKKLIGAKGEWEMLRILQLENDYGIDLTEEQRSKLKPFYIYLDNDGLKTALQYMSITTYIHRIEKYTGVEIPTTSMSTCIFNKVKHTITTYGDYLVMRDELHHDLDNSVRLCPRELQIAHDTLVIEKNEEKDRTYIADKLRQYPQIAERYEKLCKKYKCEFGGLSIRPAASAEEIILEGRNQHHCVGGDNYLSKHNEGKTTILLLRKADTPDVPYVTIEIRGDDIVQWYEAYDRQSHIEEIKPWLEKYKRFLKAGIKAIKEKQDKTLAAAV